MATCCRPPRAKTRAPAVLRAALQGDAGVSVNKVCGSGLKAIAMGAAAIMTGKRVVVRAHGKHEPRAHGDAKARWVTAWNSRKGEILDLMVFDGLYEIFYGYHMGLTAKHRCTLQISRTEQDELAC